jgi:hypothetical protein
MTTDEKLALIDRYLRAYNTFDLAGLLAMIHPEVIFQNISAGRVTAAASGVEEFRRLAEQSAELFAIRSQTRVGYSIEGDQIIIEVIFEGALAADWPPAGRAGEKLRLSGRTEFGFAEGLIARIIDLS